mgnify:CR=1 FL=1
MSQTLENQFVVAVSTRALFDFEEENAVFESNDSNVYGKLQMDRLTTPAKPGVAFALIKKLMSLNTKEHQRVETVVVSRNDPVSGMRVFRSAQAHGLTLTRGVFTNGSPAHPYLAPIGAHLFLSAHEDDVRNALQAGFPAARIMGSATKGDSLHPDEIRIAFDGDAVLFSDEAERVYQKDGLTSFSEHELKKANHPLPHGPFKPMLEALHILRDQIKEANSAIKIRTALVTARSAPSHERAIRTLMDWGIVVDEAMFLGGLDKGPFLKAFAPDFFFDDQTKHCESAAEVGPVGHVISGITNEKKAA